MLQPLVVDFEMATPLLGANRPTGDALVLAEHALRFGDAAAMAALRDHVRDTDGVPHASSIMLSSDCGGGETVCLSKLLQEYMHTDPATMAGGKTMSRGTGRKPDGTPVKSGAPQITIKGLTLKAENAFNRYPQYAAPVIRTMVVGRLSYLAPLFHCIAAIGKRRAGGWGRVSSVSITEVDADPATWGLLDAAGNPIRPLPLDLYHRLTGRDPLLAENARCKPFYWSPATPLMLCAIPHSSLLTDYRWAETVP